jgi:hypothetical protein
MRFRAYDHSRTTSSRVMPSSVMNPEEPGRATDVRRCHGARRVNYRDQVTEAERSTQRARLDTELREFEEMHLGGAERPVNDDCLCGNPLQSRKGDREGELRRKSRRTVPILNTSI